jgi:hypothetical protein
VKHTESVDVSDLVLDGLERVDWAALDAAYGRADGVPSLLRDLLAAKDDIRTAAVEELYRTVWHQGTVYECTPRVVPFLAAVVANTGGDDGTRSHIALLLSCIASATSFVLPQEPSHMSRVGWLKQPGDAAPARDLTIESRTAVAASTPPLAEMLPTAPSATQAALIAVLAAARPDNPSPALASLQPFENDGDNRLAGGARLVRLLLSRSPTEDELKESTALDAETSDYLASIAMWPLEVRAVECVRELAERVVAERLG